MPTDRSSPLAPLSTVASFLHRGEAELGRVQLDASGIRAMVQADDEGGLNPGFFSEFRVRLVVDRADLADALEVLGIADEAVHVPTEIAVAMIKHAAACGAIEGCGLLAVDAAGALRMVYPLTNVWASPNRFLVAPDEQFGAIRHAERNGWEIGGVFHSHPASAPLPSPADIAGALDPAWLHLIVGPGADPELRGFRIAHGQVREVALRIGEAR